MPTAGFTQFLGLQCPHWWVTDSPGASGVILRSNLCSHHYCNTALLLYASSL